MKGNEIEKKYGVDSIVFRKFLSDNGLQFKSGLGGGGNYSVDDGLVESYVNLYLYGTSDKAEILRREEEAKRKAEEEERLRAEEEARKRKAMSEMLITSGFNFDGYTIKKYSGYISGDDAVSISRGTDFWGSGTTDVNDNLLKALVVIRRNALIELKEAAYELGCNAVIGVDFDYLTLEPETANVSGGTTYLPYVFGVTANGNAVIIEKNED